jgi:hypothetical protein
MSRPAAWATVRTLLLVERHAQSSVVKFSASAKSEGMSYIRKRTLTRWVQVNDDDRGGARQADPLRRQEKRAKLVAAMMP